MRVADDLDSVGREAAGELGVERGRERVAGDQQRLELGLRRRRRPDRRRVEGLRGHRRHPAAPAAVAAPSSNAAAAELGVGREPGGELVLGLVERQPFGEPLGRPADRLDDLLADPRIDLGGGVADRAAREQDQQQGDEGDGADRVAGAVDVLAAALEAAHLAVVGVLAQPGSLRTGSR